VQKKLNASPLTREGLSLAGSLGFSHGPPAGGENHAEKYHAYYAEMNSSVA